METKFYTEKIKLLTSREEKEVPISVEDKECEDNAEITVKIEYSNQEYIGKGIELEWTDAFADLQKKLPDDVKLKCCLTCRHATLCPYGKLPNYVLCSHSENIESYNNFIIWLHKADTDKIEKTAFQSCEHFEYAAEKYWTYNDFLYFLKKA